MKLENGKKYLTKDGSIGTAVRPVEAFGKVFDDVTAVYFTDTKDKVALAMPIYFYDEDEGRSNLSDSITDKYDVVEEVKE